MRRSVAICGLPEAKRHKEGSGRTGSSRGCSVLCGVCVRERERVCVRVRVNVRLCAHVCVCVVHTCVADEAAVGDEADVASWGGERVVPPRRCGRRGRWSLWQRYARGKHYQDLRRQTRPAGQQRRGVRAAWLLKKPSPRQEGLARFLTPVCCLSTLPSTGSIHRSLSLIL